MARCPSLSTLTLSLASVACGTPPPRESPPVVDFGPPGLAVVEPRIPELERGMMDHADRFGFSADSREFGYCMTDGGAGATRCGFLDATGKVTVLSDFSSGTDELDPTLTAALGRRIAGDHAAPGQWRFARDLVLVWQTTGGRDPAVAAPGAYAAPSLHVGARVGTAAAAALPIVVEGRPDAYTIHPEAIVVSPDGERIAVLSHDFGGEFSDHFEIQSVSSIELARAAYTAAADEREHAGDAAGGATLRRLADQTRATRD